MPYISLKNVGVNFPIYGAGASSLKKTLAASVTGGRFGTSTIANEFYVTRFVQGRNGLGSALAVLILVLVLPIVIMNRQAQKRAEEMMGA